MYLPQISAYLMVDYDDLTVTRCIYIMVPDWVQVTLQFNAFYESTPMYNLNSHIILYHMFTLGAMNL